MLNKNFLIRVKSSLNKTNLLFDDFYINKLNKSAPSEMRRANLL